MYVPVMMDIAIGVVTTARGFGYDVLLLTNDEGADGIRRVASTARADAVILTDIGMADDRIAAVKEAEVDAVLIGVPADPAGLDCVDLDFEQAGRDCASTTWPGLGIARWRSSARPRASTGVISATLSGPCAATGEGDGVRHRLVHRPCEGSYEAAAGALSRILEERPHTTGLIVQNEAILPPLLSLLRTAGRSIRSPPRTGRMWHGSRLRNRSAVTGKRLRFVLCAWPFLLTPERTAGEPARHRTRSPR